MAIFVETFYQNVSIVWQFTLKAYQEKLRWIGRDRTKFPINLTTSLCYTGVEY